jgi:flagellar motor protein MotB
MAELRVGELLAEIDRLKQNPLEKYLKLADAAREDILLNLKNVMKEAGALREEDVRIIPEQGILRLSGDVLFPSGISTIMPGTRSDYVIKSLALALSKVLPCFSLGPAGNANKECNPNAAFVDAVFIEGHTDNIPVGVSREVGVTDNLTLSAHRAISAMKAVYKYQPHLNQMFSISPSQTGLDLGQGNSPLINASAFGETRPVMANATPDGRQSNRRIDIRILMYSPRTENLDFVKHLMGQQ